MLQGGPGTWSESVHREALLRVQMKLVRRRPHLLPRSAKRDPGGVMPGVGGYQALSALETEHRDTSPESPWALLVLRDRRSSLDLPPATKATHSKWGMVKRAAEQTEASPF